LLQGNQQQKAEAQAKLATLREAALKCVFQIITALDAWAGPIKDAGERALAEQDDTAAAAAVDKAAESPSARESVAGGAPLRPRD
jgi:hypothetical protein